ncbi:MAG: hypothetical protein HKN79_00720 [Flavobacteriales bacterium]|nr:hypothetical protein [Flavobacteriales bacterium]
MTLSEKLEIPLFPLSVFLLPGERMQLHIFEPRYKQLFAELEEGDNRFGIPYATGRVTRKFGSRCRLLRVIKRYSSGELDVLVESEGIFKLDDFQQMKEDKLYPFGKVSLLRELNREEVDEHVMQTYDAMCENLSGSDLHFHTVESRSTLAILSSLNASSEEKYRFVQLPDTASRNSCLLGMIRILDSLILQEKATEEGFYLS